MLIQFFVDAGACLNVAKLLSIPFEQSINLFIVFIQIQNKMGEKHAKCLKLCKISINNTYMYKISNTCTSR